MKDNAVIKDLLLQALETEQGGQKVYEAAIACAKNDELKEEWQKYLQETRDHERILRTAFEKLALNPDEESPGRLIVRGKAQALVMSMTKALESMPGDTPQLVAAECVVEAETKDHQNWELIGQLVGSKALAKAERDALQEAHSQVEDQEDEHLYHSKGWCRELWIQSLGMPAVLPPPEEEKKVKNAAEAAQAEREREEML